MPDYPDTKKLEADVKRRIHPRPASATSSPATDRAVEELRKAFPVDMTGVDVRDMSWNNPYSGTNTLGTTNEDSQIQVNPALGAAFPQAAIQGTLAHELQHVRQNRASKNPRLDMLRELGTSYRARPREEEARAAKETYLRAHPELGEEWGMEYPITSQSFPASPLVKR